MQLECCGAEGPRDWQHSAWARAQEAAGAEAEGAGAAGDALDLSVGAPTNYYWVPPSCCVLADKQEVTIDSYFFSSVHYYNYYSVTTPLVS